MARQPRFCVPECPQHIIQRGNNKTPMFASSTDFLVFRTFLGSAIRRFECELHAYVFMTNHVHLLMSCRHTRGISRMMQSVGRRYVRYYNDRHGRTGTLWEGRYRATIIDSEHYLFSCSRYIEENPLRAGMVRSPSEYSWSSYGFNAMGLEDTLITPHGRYVALGQTAASRQGAYLALFRDPNDLSTLRDIREATNHAWALGSEQFCRRVSRFGRRAAPLPSGPSSGGDGI